MTEQAQLSKAQQVANHNSAMATLIMWPFWLLFFIKINIQQSKKWRFAYPVNIDIDTAGHAPNAATKMLRAQYVHTFSWGAAYHIVDNQVRLVESIHVSSKQAAWADQLLYTDNWHIYTKQRSLRNLQHMPTPLRPVKKRKLTGPWKKLDDMLK